MLGKKYRTQWEKLIHALPSSVEGVCRRHSQGARLSPTAVALVWGPATSISQARRVSFVPTTSLASKAAVTTVLCPGKAAGKPGVTGNSAFWEMSSPVTRRNPDEFQRQGLTRGARWKQKPQGMGSSDCDLRGQIHSLIQSHQENQLGSGRGGPGCVSPGVRGSALPPACYILHSFSGKFSVMRWSP